MSPIGETLPIHGNTDQRPISQSGTLINLTDLDTAEKIQQRLTGVTATEAQRLLVLFTKMKDIGFTQVSNTADNITALKRLCRSNNDTDGLTIVEMRSIFNIPESRFTREGFDAIAGTNPDGVPEENTHMTITELETFVSGSWRLYKQMRSTSQYSTYSNDLDYFAQTNFVVVNPTNVRQLVSNSDTPDGGQEPDYVERWNGLAGMIQTRLDRTPRPSQPEIDMLTQLQQQIPRIEQQIANQPVTGNADTDRTALQNVARQRWMLFLAS
jgi:hypothetical protein